MLFWTFLTSELESESSLSGQAFFSIVFFFSFLTCWALDFSKQYRYWWITFLLVFGNHNWRITFAWRFNFLAFRLFALCLFGFRFGHLSIFTLMLNFSLGLPFMLFDWVFWWVCLWKWLIIGRFALLMLLFIISGIWVWVFLVK